MSTPPAPRQGHRRLAILFAVVAVVAVIGVLGGGAVLYGRTQLEAPASTHDQQVVISVGQGESLNSLTTDLDNHHLIKSAFWFSWFARFKGLSDKLHPGHYRLDSGMGASAIVAKLEGPADAEAQRLALPEGLTARQTAQRVEQDQLGITAQQYLDAALAGQFNEPFLQGLSAQTIIEGFLFPDTYQVPFGASAHQVLQMQLDAFARKAAPALAAPPGGLSGYQLVILASIVEREARFDADRPHVAGVLLNRLQNGMLLQVDASVMYGLGRPGQQPSATDLKVDTPYNTYLHAGLPPTPISNPGVAALSAAAQPLATADLFYVSDACGHIYYSRTEAEHEKQVAMYVGKPCSA